MDDGGGGSDRAIGKVPSLTPINAGYLYESSIPVASAIGAKLNPGPRVADQRY